nr:structural protein VP3 [uncultured Prevotella sp.]
MRKPVYLCVVIALIGISCSKGNRVLTAKNTSEAYDSVVIESLPGYVLNPKYITWVVDKQGRSCKYIQHNVSGEGKVKDTTDIVQVSDERSFRVKELVDDMYVTGSAKDVIAVKNNDFCTDQGSLFVTIYYPGKHIRHEYEWGKTDVKYSPEFKELVQLIGLQMFE